MATLRMRKTSETIKSTTKREPIAEGSEIVVGNLRFKATKNVALPSFKWEENEEKFFTILSAITIREPREGEPTMARGKGGKKQIMEPPHVAQIRDLVSNQQFEMIFNAGLLLIIERNYPEETYIGKSFRALKLPKERANSGFMFNPFEVQEIEVA